MDEINVEFLGGETVPARVLSSEPAADLSLLQLSRVPRDAKGARLAASDTVRVADQIMIVGATYGLSHSMSAGWISARWPANSVYRAMPLAEFLQTDATISTGNSGGPMFNMAGEVIGTSSRADTPDVNTLAVLPLLRRRIASPCRLPRRVATQVPARADAEATRLAIVM